MVRWAPWNIPFERRLQTAAIVAALCIPVTTIVILNLVCILLPWLWAFYIPYVLWIFFDSAPYTKGRPAGWLKRARFWKYFRGYFPIKLKIVEKLDPKKQYFFAAHPHGIMSLGVWSNFLADNYSSELPGLDIRVLTVSANFRIPFWREFLLAMGLVDASRDTVRQVLDAKEKLSVMVIAGGAAESLDARPNTNLLTLNKRKGFVRIALSRGIPLVPVFSFGENNLYDQVPNPSGSALRRLQVKFLTIFGFTTPIFKGRGIFNYDLGLLPYRQPVYTVVGKPIEMPHIPNPNEAEIDEYHAKYVAALEALYNENKDLIPDSPEMKIVN